MTENGACSPQTCSVGSTRTRGILSPAPATGRDTCNFITVYYHLLETEKHKSGSILSTSAACLAISGRGQTEHVDHARLAPEDITTEGYRCCASNGQVLCKYSSELCLPGAFVAETEQRGEEQGSRWNTETCWTFDNKIVRFLCIVVYVQA